MDITKATIHLSPPPSQGERQEDKELRKACADFESLLTYQLLKTMRQTVEKSGLFDGGRGEEIYESLFDMELSKRMSGSGANSLSEQLYRQLKHSTGVASESPSSEIKKVGR
jgi:peptidoglycan hydrolase FlgJ